MEEKVGELLKAKKLSLSTAERCTGGGIAALSTSVPGSSEYFNGSIVAYSNEIKMSLLHVSAETLEKHGAEMCIRDSCCSVFILSVDRVSCFISCSFLSRLSFHLFQKKIGRAHV